MDMISTPSTAPFFACDLHRSLSALRRELRFIARTLARLRHRHHVLLVCSSVQRSTQLSLLDSVRTLLLGGAPSLTSPKHAIVEDIESAPASPITESSSPSWPESPPRRPPLVAGSPFSTSSTEEPRETVCVIVDERCPTAFTIPVSSISTFLTLHPPSTITTTSADDNDDDPFTTTSTATAISTLSLPSTTAADFHDFTLWLRTARILPHPHHAQPWAVEHHAHRLLRALALGLHLHSRAYQAAALHAFHALAALLPWPEDYVTPIYALTKPPASCAATAARPHPARALIVQVVAAATHGPAKRPVRRGPRDPHVERGDRIRASAFWRDYDALCAARGGAHGDSAYPARWRWEDS